MDLEELINNRYNYNFINNPRSDNIIKIIHLFSFKTPIFFYDMI